MRLAYSCGLAVLLLLGACSDNAADADGETDTGEPEDYGPVRGDLVITSIEVSQSVVQPLYEAGVVVSPVDYGVPLVPNRHMWVRALWATPAGWTTRRLTARLHLEYPDGTELVYEDRETASGAAPYVEGASSPTDLLTGFYWRLAPEDVVPGLRYSVTVVEPKPADDIPASTGQTQWPRENNTSLPIQADPAALSLYIVGVRYDIPGCSTDTSVLPENELEAIRSGFESWSAIETNSVTIDTSLSIDISSPTNVISLLDVVGPIRAEYPDIPEAFFLILLDDCSPVPDGILGVAPVNSDPPVQGEWGTRFGAGLWNPNDIAESVNTAVHEVGHAQGGLHAPCGGVDGPDPAYPHENATLGARGLSTLTAAFYEPESYTDFMSYCRPYWISDYRFSKNYTVQKTLTSWAGAGAPAPTPTTPAGYTGVVLSGVVQPGGETRWWINENARPPAASLDGELRVELRTPAGKLELGTNTKLLPDLPGARLVQIPLVGGVELGDIVGIEVHGALELSVTEPVIVDARNLAVRVRDGR